MEYGEELRKAMLNLDTKHSKAEIHSLIEKNLSSSGMAAVAERAKRVMSLDQKN